MTRRRSQGASLVLVLVVVSALVVLVDMALSATAREARVHSSRTEQAQAFYLAEAGRQRALTTLANCNAWGHEGVWFPLGAGEYRVSASREPVTPLQDRWTLTCVGRVQGAAGAAAETVTQQVLVTRQDESLIEKVEVVPDTWRRT